jgi:cob(I)alamin adenosyltransferase
MMPAALAKIVEFACFDAANEGVPLLCRVAERAALRLLRGSDNDHAVLVRYLNALA